MMRPKELFLSVYEIKNISSGISPLPNPAIILFRSPTGYQDKHMHESMLLEGGFKRTIGDGFMTRTSSSSPFSRKSGLGTLPITCWLTRHILDTSSWTSGKNTRELIKQLDQRKSAGKTQPTFSSCNRIFNNLAAELEIPRDTPTTRWALPSLWLKRNYFELINILVRHMGRRTSTSACIHTLCSTRKYLYGVPSVSSGQFKYD